MTEQTNLNHLKRGIPRIALLSMHGCPVSKFGGKDTGGMNVYVLQIAKELGSLGFYVDVFTRAHDPKDPQIINIGNQSRLIHITAGPYEEIKESLYQHIPTYLNKIEEFRTAENLNYSLIHSHYWLSGKAGLSLAESWGIPHITTFHTLARSKIQARAGESEPYHRVKTESEVLQGANALIVSTEQEKEDLSNLYGVSHNSIRTIPAGVDLDLFQPLNREYAKQSLGISESKILLSVGRIEPLKGLDLLLRSMALLNDIPDIRLIIVGGDTENNQELDRLKLLASDLGISERTTFTGAVEQSDLPEYYSAADAFILPSYYESFGLVALEAMACGTPVISSRVGGPKSFISSGLNGYLIPWRCPEPYAQRLEVLIANPCLAESMGISARKKAKTMSWNTVARRISTVYSETIMSDWTEAAGA